MPTIEKARSDVLLTALCAIAESLPRDTSRAAANELVRRMIARGQPPALADEAVSADLARILAALGCLLMPPASGPAGSTSEAAQPADGAEQGAIVHNAVAPLDRTPW